MSIPASYRTSKVTLATAALRQHHTCDKVAVHISKLRQTTSAFRRCAERCKTRSAPLRARHVSGLATASSVMTACPVECRKPLDALPQVYGACECDTRSGRSRTQFTPSPWISTALVALSRGRDAAQQLFDASELWQLEPCSRVSRSARDGLLHRFPGWGSSQKLTGLNYGLFTRHDVTPRCLSHRSTAARGLFYTCLNATRWTLP